MELKVYLLIFTIVGTFLVCDSEKKRNRESEPVLCQNSIEFASAMSTLESRK